MGASFFNNRHAESPTFDDLIAAAWQVSLPSEPFLA